MSRLAPESGSARRRPHAVLFAALGDETRLSLVTALSAGEPRSIAQLTGGTRLTRQAITKHLRVLENAGLVHSVRAGRESRFAFDPAPVNELKDYLAWVSQQWDQALGRLKSLVEG
ncbi:MAG TPA: metalloregulator ArsR/SmtB family transcription factor [Steroidobacteraceae bacterium]|nr:metalloregulator ArsR/SmtB family transcription factor [Steroidobacteraceae bacterium]